MSTTSPPSLLARLVAERGWQPEPVATAALWHLLGSSEAAGRALQDLTAEMHPAGDFHELAFTEQAVDALGEGRPDVIGYDTSGWRLLIEAKFDAALTAAQAGAGYLDWLEAGRAGILMFLVPRDRLANLWRHVLAGPCGVPLEEIPPVNALDADKPFLLHAIGDGRVVSAISWESLLERLHKALDTGQNSLAASDLLQLEGLVRQRIHAGWIPEMQDDLPARVGRQLDGLKRAAHTAAERVSLGKVRHGSNDWGPARWVTSVNGGKLFWVGVRLPTWGRLGLSPIWAVVYERHLPDLAVYRKALAPLNQQGGPGVYELDKWTLGIPVLSPIGAEQGEVEGSFEAQLIAIRDHLIPLGKTSDDDALESDLPSE